ncbi:hypothetical protein LEMA_P100170.1 [Plenodomus lingam JN3]|uniref:Uncharacterized protein n=2 Tax=Leptosphaeria maculans TaxID=5022 RepID=E5A026_LEPMJ|nr:hypothetical protein LEMA_P100170.1 [Plenodomus lingam JN3]CBX96886.1 hypothetical protein LEMA_P100170.1 [Plenodomus lingam JN3]
MSLDSSSIGSGDPDMILIGELLEEISGNPPAIAARKLLVEHYFSVGWHDAALENAKELKELAPKDSDVIKSLKILEKKAPQPPASEEPKKLVSLTSNPSAKQLEWDPKSATYKTVTQPKGSKQSSDPTPPANIDLDTAKKDLVEGYATLQARTAFVFSNLVHLQTLQKKAGVAQSQNISRIEVLAHGGKPNSSLKAEPPSSVRSVARKAKDYPTDATDILVMDLEHAMKWMRASYDKQSDADNDNIREFLVKRKNMLADALPDQLKIHCDLALMHMEHEHLGRNYANTETMLMDSVRDIPRENFYVTEDNYAWDLSELVDAIKANSGVLRNPLSKEMFTPHDIKGILMHPLGRPISALAVAQHEMSKGIRIATIEKMEALAKILLEDQSSETLPSRVAVDEFLAYIATLPELEQKAIDEFKCPAKDSHTGQSYDFSIGESVRDAKGNRVCFHKTGDFITQAAAYLRQNTGVAPDEEKCIVM